MYCYASLDCEAWQANDEGECWQGKFTDYKVLDIVNEILDDSESMTGEHIHHYCGPAPVVVTPSTGTADDDICEITTPSSWTSCSIWSWILGIALLLLLLGLICCGISELYGESEKGHHASRDLVLQDNSSEHGNSFHQTTRDIQMSQQPVYARPAPQAQQQMVLVPQYQRAMIPQNVSFLGPQMQSFGGASFGGPQQAPTYSWQQRQQAMIASGYPQGYQPIQQNMYGGGYEEQNQQGQGYQQPNPPSSYQPRYGPNARK